MALTLNESTVTPETIAGGVARQCLLTAAHTTGGSVLLDRLQVTAGQAHAISVAAGDLAWLQILDGSATLAHGNAADALTQAHIVFLPPRFSGKLATPAGVTLLYATVPDAARFDANFVKAPPSFRIVDWTREPMLDSEHDARRRIYLATPKLFGTTAIKGEMIPNHLGARRRHLHLDTHGPQPERRKTGARDCPPHLGGSGEPRGRVAVPSPGCRILEFARSDLDSNQTRPVAAGHPLVP